MLIQIEDTLAIKLPMARLFLSRPIPLVIAVAIFRVEKKSTGGLLPFLLVREPFPFIGDFIHFYGYTILALQLLFG
jgi:hypothetical protein